MRRRFRAEGGLFLPFALLGLLLTVLAGCGGSSGECKGAGCLDTPPNGGEDVAMEAGGPEVTPEDAAAPNDTALPDVTETVQGSVCSTGQTNGCASATHIFTCAGDGESWVETPCFGPDGDGRCVSDVCTTCTPGNRKCVGDDAVGICKQDGSEYEIVEECNGSVTGRVCSEGLCTKLCELSIKFKDYMGCEYWAVDLDNAFVACGGRSGYCDAQGAPYAIVVSNPHPRWPAEVTLWAWDEQAGRSEQVLYDRDGLPLDLSFIQPGELRVYYVGLEGNDVNGTELAKKAYRISSSLPITAYQFNPLENVDVFSNDASLLLPSNALGRYYFVMTREQTFEQLRGYFTVIAVNPGNTNVSLTVTASTEVSGDGSIRHMEPGDSISLVLEQYDVLNIETNQIGADLTGSIILADRPVAVFGGSEAANAPNTNHCIANPTYDPGQLGSVRTVCEGDLTTPCDGPADCSFFITCCADHLEQQLFPVKTWGTRYLAARSVARGNEGDNWRILAAEDGTRVTTLPPVLSIPVLNKGEWFDFDSSQDFEIHANKPIMVGQFLQAEQAPNPGSQPDDAGTGDPAFILAVPLSQFREDYVFLAPNKYEFDYVNIIAPRDATVDFDGSTLRSSQFEVFGTGEFKVARFLIQDGVHTIHASDKVSVIVYGYDQYVSYGYPGGLNLTELREDPGAGAL